MGNYGSVKKSRMSPKNTRNPNNWCFLNVCLGLHGGPGFSGSGSSNAIGSAWRTKHLSFVKNQNKKHIHSGPESGSILALRLMFWDLFSWWHFYVTHHFSPQFERIFLEFSRSIICKSKLFKKKALDISHPKVWCFKLKEPLCLVTFCLVNPWVKSVDVFLPGVGGSSGCLEAAFAWSGWNKIKDREEVLSTTTSIPKQPSNFKTQSFAKLKNWLQKKTLWSWEFPFVKYYHCFWRTPKKNVKKSHNLY